MPSEGQPVPLGPTYGAELLATFLSVALWGTTCMQTLIYFIQYPKDRPILKFLVVWLWLANTTHEILIVKGVYDSQIVDFCNYDRTQVVVPEFLWQALLTSLVALAFQMFFTHRIWIFSGQRWFYWAIIVPVCSFELIGILVFITFGAMIPTAAELVSPTPTSIYIAVQAVAASVDLAIAVGLLVLLIQRKDRALKGSRSVLQKLLILTINTGIWTALFAVLALVVMVALKGTLIYAALYFPLCSLYCNTVLGNLNARDYLKERHVVTEGGMIDGMYLGPVFASQQTAVGSQSAQADRRLTVQVEVNKSVKYDDDESVLRVRDSKSNVNTEDAETA